MGMWTEPTASCTNKIKLFSGPGTRRWPRFHISDVPSIKGVRSSAGSRIKVDNVSRGGALLQTRRHQVPGTRIWLNVETTEGIVQLCCVALRSSVSAPDEILPYQTAVVFDRSLKIPNVPAAQPAEIPQTVLSPSSIPADIPSIDNGASFELSHGEDTSMIGAFLSIRFHIEQDAELDEALRLNNW